MRRKPPKEMPKHTEDQRPFLAKVVAEEALRLQLPWKVAELFQVGEKAAAAAQNEWHSSLLGMTRQEFLKLRVAQAIKEAGERIHAWASAGDESLPPSEHEIGMALEVFSAGEWLRCEPDKPPQRGAKWAGLSMTLSRPEVDAVRSYVYVEAQTPDKRQQREKELEQRFGARKTSAFLSGIILRDTELWLEKYRAKLEPVSDAHWVVFWDELASLRNIQGRGHTKTGRSLKELASDRSTANRLRKEDKTIGRVMEPTPYRVKKLRERRKALPFEEFDGDYLTYLVTVYFTEVYKSYLRSKGENR